MDATARGKWVFWCFAALTLALGALPSLVLVETARDYRRLLAAFSPGALKRVPMRHTPHAGGLPAGKTLEFVGFRLWAPHAKSVRLGGNFNRWQAQGLSLSPQSGYWETLLPLPKGTHYYAFEVDGRWMTDPKAPSETVRGGRRVSVKIVP